VVEAQDRVGGRVLTEHLDDGAFIDHGGQWVSPGQGRIIALAAELGVELFDDWDAGLTVHWERGRRTTWAGIFPPGHEGSEDALRTGARALTGLAAELPEHAPWRAPRAADWDARSFRGLVTEVVDDRLAAAALANAIEGVFGGGPGETSALAALAIIRSGAHEIARLLADGDPGPERRFAGGAQQLCERMAAGLGDRLVLGAFVSEIAHEPDAVTVTGGGRAIRARRALVTLPPALAGRIRYSPALPAARDHLTQRSPMGWIIKVHCVYPTRFWAEEGLSGRVVSDEGDVRVVADNSPPSGSPGVLVGFIHGTGARRLAPAPREARRQAVVADLVRHLGGRAAAPDSYHEWSWGDDPHARGAYGGFFRQGVWTAYGHALRPPIGPIHWAGTEASTAWNAKMEGAIHSGEAVADEVLASLG